MADILPSTPTLLIHSKYNTLLLNCTLQYQSQLPITPGNISWSKMSNGSTETLDEKNQFLNITLYNAETVSFKCSRQVFINGTQATYNDTYNVTVKGKCMYMHVCLLIYINI